MTFRFRVALLGVLFCGVALAGQQAPPPDGAQPRFRAGANLVRVDAYVTEEGAPVRDLAPEDFEVLEDNVAQRIESFQLIQPRGPGALAERREPNTVAESREMANQPDARLFVLFLDVWHVQLAGSHRAQGPIVQLLDRVIGQDDMFGLMTSDMSARSLTFARRRESVEAILRTHWYWGERDRLNTSDPREQEIESCYPHDGASLGIAQEMIARRREGRTLNALEDLIIHLEGLRDERKFVFLLSEGWLMSGPDQTLARRLGSGTPDGRAGGVPPVGIDPGGRLRVEPDRGTASFSSCERERSLLAYADHQYQFQQLLQRANRANVSFYPVDARGLVAFDEPIGPRKPIHGPVADARRLMERQEALRTLAVNTDGYAILNTNDITSQLNRIVADTGAYYLLGYYSSNTKLDGRFRKITVRVRRPGVEVRSRPGYLAPTEAELASTRVEALMNGAPPGHTTIPPAVARAFDSLAPVRGAVPVRIHTAGAPGRIWLTGELDPATLKLDEWQPGGRVRVTFEHAQGGTAPAVAEIDLAPQQRAFQVTPPRDAALVPGRYVVRVQLTPGGGSVPLQMTTDVTVPETTSLVAGAGLASRRGPSTGLQYVPTADARYRRTERIRFEVPRASGEAEAAARLLGRDGQPLNLAVALSDRADEATGQRFVVADLTLAPLAQGEYALEVTVRQGERSESAMYAFRVVP